MEIEAVYQQIVGYARAHGARRVVLFGSRARARFNEAGGRERFRRTFTR